MNISEAIEYLEKQIGNPNVGLPEDIFLFASRITPMVNIDLLIKDERGRTLLAWRDDAYAGKGWHIPGGVVRFKETLEMRIQKVAELEIGTQVEYDLAPLTIQEAFFDQDTRGHFISVLYKCFLSETFAPENKGLSESDQGYLRWFDACPDNIVNVHEMYRKYI